MVSYRCLVAHLLNESQILYSESTLNWHNNQKGRKEEKRKRERNKNERNSQLDLTRE